MREFVYEMHLIVTIQAENKEHSYAKLKEAMCDLPFPIELDWIETLDDYEIDE